MQVDPIKPTLKALGAKRLKLGCYELLSSFAFKLNLRRYTQAALPAPPPPQPEQLAAPAAVGAGTRAQLADAVSDDVSHLPAMLVAALAGTQASLADDMVGRCSLTLWNPR